MSEYSEKQRTERTAVKSPAFVENKLRHKKKSQTRPPRKSDHQHHWEQCVIEFERRSFSKERGYVAVPDCGFGAYCPVCGKLNLGKVDHYRWWRRPDPYHCTLSDEAQRELNPSTRTLPTFHVDDWLRAKFVNLEGNK